MVSLQVEMFNLCMGHFKTYMKPRQGLFSTFKWDIPIVFIVVCFFQTAHELWFAAVIHPLF